MRGQSLAPRLLPSEACRIALSYIYSTGRIQGIREERAKRKKA